MMTIFSSQQPVEGIAANFYAVAAAHEAALDLEEASGGVGNPDYNSFWMAEGVELGKLAATASTSPIEIEAKVGIAAYLAARGGSHEDRYGLILASIRMDLLRLAQQSGVSATEVKAA